MNPQFDSSPLRRRTHCDTNLFDIIIYFSEASMAKQFQNVTVTSKANIFFDGKVVSHSVLFADGSKKTLGLIYPGTFRFNVGTSEVMEITAGSCSVRIGEGGEVESYAPGSAFNVPAGSFFEITVSDGIVEYICSFA